MRSLVLSLLCLVAACQAPSEPVAPPSPPPSAVPSASAPSPTPSPKPSGIPSAEPVSPSPAVAPVTAASATPTPAPTGSASPVIWQPKPGLRLHWQLSSVPETPTGAAVVDLDLEDSPPAVIQRWQRAGSRVICYFSAGSWEDWRRDAAAFAPSVLGRDYDGWAGERWLDIRSQAVRARMAARLDEAVAKGCDAVEPDNMDSYQNKTGFPLTAADQLDYNRWLSAQAHARGLSIGLKNDPDQAAELVADFDWALTEGCHEEGWCDQLQPFGAAGKAVWHVEYTDTDVDFDAACAATARTGQSVLLKRRELDAWEQLCPEDLQP
ncbi:MAG: endo alpha-1,4 polygalactosaminidase [Candidatus Sericytochromatia bacterium]